MNEIHSITVIAIIAMVTVLLRFLPFIVFGRNQDTPDYITYISSVLPYAIMGMLVVYCMRNVDITADTHGIQELIAGMTVVGLHVWKGNTLVSIVAGTAVYMLLIQCVF